MSRKAFGIALFSFARRCLVQDRNLTKDRHEPHCAGQRSPPTLLVALAPVPRPGDIVGSCNDVEPRSACPVGPAARAGLTRSFCRQCSGRSSEDRPGNCASMVARYGCRRAGTVRSLILARIDRLSWSPFHTLMVAAGRALDPGRPGDHHRQRRRGHPLEAGHTRPVLHPGRTPRDGLPDWVRWSAPCSSAGCPAAGPNLLRRVTWSKVGVSDSKRDLPAGASRVRAKAIAVFFGTLGPVIYGSLIDDDSEPSGCSWVTCSQPS